MFKDIIKAQLKNEKPAGYIHKLTVFRNELNDMIKEFDQEWTWCSGCQTYVKNSESLTGIDGNRNVLRCRVCNNILKFID